MEEKLSLNYFIEPGQQGLYLFLPFTLPANVESIRLQYKYPRYDESRGADGFLARREINIIDLGLIDPGGEQVGASGSDKSEIWVGERAATPGYRPTRLEPGEWKILVGAYKVAPGGVTVQYEVTVTFKERRWLKGDLHTHTLASDGVLTAEELGWRALRHGLDFLAITDHNQPISAEVLPKIDGLTFIPGLEWTHYQGHANFLGVARPYEGTFAANTMEEISARFVSARRRGATIVINHPFDEVCGFLLDWKTLPFDCLEIWNGPMRESNLKALGLWHSLLAAGHKIPACGGSDYHRDTPFLFLGGPTTCVYAQSAGESDILKAVREGHAYMTFAPNGPWVELAAGEAIMGDKVHWEANRELQIMAGNLVAGDVVRVITGNGSTPIAQASAAGDVQAVYHMPAPGFARLEILRTFLPGIPMLPALISNPIYFET
jgi:hypothetical protein